MNGLGAYAIAAEGDRASAAELVEGVRVGDSVAESVLMARYRDTIVTTLKRRGSPQDAEDLAHDALVTILQRLRGRGINEPDKLDGFMIGVANRKWLAERRKLARRKTQTDSSLIEGQASESISSVDQLIRHERGRAVRRLIDELTVERDRAILRKYYLFEQDKSQVCRDLNLTGQQFERVIHRARRRLRDIVVDDRPELVAP